MRRVPPLEFLNRAPRRRMGWFMLLLAVPLLGWQLVRYTQALDQRNEEAAVAERSEGAGPRSVRAAAPADVRYVSQATQAATQLAAPWAGLLALLDEHNDADVALLRVEPNARSGQVKLVAEARDANSMVAFLASLESDRRLTQVTLLNQQLQRQTPGEPLRFTVSGLWLPYVANGPAEAASAPAPTAAAGTAQPGGRS